MSWVRVTICQLAQTLVAWRLYYAFHNDFTFHSNLTVGRLKLIVSCGLRLINDLVNFKSTHTRGYGPLNFVSLFVTQDSRTNGCQNRNLTFAKVRLCWKH